MDIKCLNDAWIPKLYISIEAMARVTLIVDSCEKEVGWMGLVRNMESDGRPKLLLDRPYVPAQEVNGTTCDLDPTGKGSYFEWCMSLPAEEQPLVKWWGHSHVNMGVAPSGTDMTTFWEHVENDPESPFVMTIHNKQGKSHANIYLGRGLYVSGVDLLLDYGIENIAEDVQKQLKENVREKTYVKSYPSNGYNTGKQIGVYEGQRSWGGGYWQQPSEPVGKTGNAESNAMGLRHGGEPQPAKSSVQPKRRRKKQSRSNGRKSAA